MKNVSSGEKAPENIMVCRILYCVRVVNIPHVWNNCFLPQSYSYNLNTQLYPRNTDMNEQKKTY